MSSDIPLLVVDTNTLVRSFWNLRSPSAMVLELCRRRVVRLLLSKPVLDEYREVLSYDEIVSRRPEITGADVEVAVRRLRYVSEFQRAVRFRFTFDRDPEDEKFLELAIAGRASDIVTHDRDILSLAAAHTDAAKRFRRLLPGLQIRTAEGFLQWLQSR